MSKVAEAKVNQGWRKHGPVCSNCKHFTSIKEKRQSLYMDYEEESMMRCILSSYHFKVGKSNWCQKHEWKGIKDET